MHTDSEKLQNLRHSFAHLLAAAVFEIYPNARPTIGPAVENGFYYDFDFPKPITEGDLKAIETRMRKILPTWKGFNRHEVSTNEARKEFTGNPYKLELIDELEKSGETITIYQSGEFRDLCRGGHVEDAKDLNADAFALTKLAGAYWRGNEKNPQLQRIYGAAFATKEELDAFLTQQEEAERRDHRKIGKQLDLFSFHAVAPGAVFWHGNGMVIWNELERLLRETLLPAGYTEVQTPLMVKPELFTKSGHLAHYREYMFHVTGRDEEFYLKPMNCPEATLIYAAEKRSYRDLPIRLMEIGRIHRNERSGTLGGIFRVRQITQDDAHIYCRPDQLEGEITALLKLSKNLYALFGLTPTFSLATKPDHAMGEAKLWKQAEVALAQALEANRIAYEEKPKDGTFYAPKIDIDITDAIGRRWQLCTIQADLVMVPSLPGVEYTDAKGKMQKPVVVHRTIFGSFERFIGILIEHYAGAFPVWLAPEQVWILNVGAKHETAASKLAAEMKTAGIRATADLANETVPNKIRKAANLKIPYTIVLGDKELKSGKVAVRDRGSKEVRNIEEKAFIAEIQNKIQARN